jgi:hypothetical protein
MIVWLIARLDRLSSSAKRLAVFAAAVAVLGVVIAAVTLPVPPDGAARRRATAQVPSKGIVRGTSPRRVAPPVSASGLLRARGVAERFLDAYLRFAYGRGEAPAGSSLTAAMRHELPRARAGITPVTRRRRPRVLSLQMAAMTPGFALATAVVKDGGLAAYPLRVALEEHAGRWLVSGVEER